MKKRIEKLFLSTLVLWNIGLSAQHKPIQSSKEKCDNEKPSIEKQQQFQKGCQNATYYNLERTSINSIFSDFGATVYGGRLIFTSSRKHFGFLIEKI